ncbi:MAG: hypothetical protein ACR2PZ_04710 [Pseudomonadales bacterium]
MPKPTRATDASAAAEILTQLSARVSAGDYDVAQQDLERLQAALRQVTDPGALRAAHTRVQVLIGRLKSAQEGRQQRLRTQRNRNVRRRGYQQIEALGKP